MKITYERVLALHPCWSEEKLKAALPVETEVTLAGLLTLEKSHARWLVSRLLSTELRTQWASYCILRAETYASRAGKASLNFSFTSAEAQYARDAFASFQEAVAINEHSSDLIHPISRAASIAATTMFTAYWTALATGENTKDAEMSEHKLAMQDALNLLG